MPIIKDISCHKVVNSRGDWTIETTVTLDDGCIGIQTVPEGASKGENEALDVPAEKAAEIVSTTFKDALVGLDAENQKNIDLKMIKMDGTPNKSRLGGNSILSISLAVAEAASVSKKMELYEYLKFLYTGKPEKWVPKDFPTPLFNILNGGKHANNGLSFQEFMVIPSRETPYDKALEMGINIYHKLEEYLSSKGYDVDVGDEGGFAPNDFTVKKALDFVKKAAIHVARPGTDVFFGMDVAAESFYKNGKYIISEENLTLTSTELGDYHKKLLDNYEIIYIEDPFYEGDLDGWADFSKNNSHRVMVVADDLVVTKVKYLKEAINKKLANSVIVKLNQVGTLSETLDFIKLAKENNLSVIVSHRSGETAESTFIADLALGVGAEFLKAGAPVRGERVVKYNRLLDVFLEKRSS